MLITESRFSFIDKITLSAFESDFFVLSGLRKGDFLDSSPFFVGDSPPSSATKSSSFFILTVESRNVFLSPGVVPESLALRAALLSALILEGRSFPSCLLGVGDPLDFPSPPIVGEASPRPPYLPLAAPAPAPGYRTVGYLALGVTVSFSTLFSSLFAAPAAAPEPAAYFAPAP
jgi:hypothetical protein